MLNTLKKAWEVTPGPAGVLSLGGGGQACKREWKVWSVWFEFFYSNEVFRYFLGTLFKAIHFKTSPCSLCC